MAFTNLDSIILKCGNHGKLIKCKVMTATRTTTRVEKKLGHGWYQFVRENNLIVGDKLTFKLFVEPTALQVQINLPI
jgi:hypothetical protein